MTAQQLRDKLMARWQGHNANDDALARAEFTHELIALAAEQRTALERCQHFEITDGCGECSAIWTNTYQNDTAKEALAATDARLKSMGVL